MSSIGLQHAVKETSTQSLILCNGLLSFIYNAVITVAMIVAINNKTAKIPMTIHTQSGGLVEKVGQVGQVGLGVGETVDQEIIIL